MSIFSSILGGIPIIGGIATGIAQNSEANKIDKANFRPTQTVDPIYQQNVNQAEQMAQTGLPSQQYNNTLNNLNRNLSGGLRVLGRSANPGSGLASLLRGQNDAVMGLDAQSGALRNQNLLNLMRQRSILAQQRQAAFDYNNKDKYSENLAKSQALKGAAMQNIASAGNQLGQIGALAASGGFGGNGLFGKASVNPWNTKSYLPSTDSLIHNGFTG